MEAVIAAVPAGLVWVPALGGLIMGLAALLKAYSVIRKVELDAGGSMRGDLLARINVLEAKISELEASLARKEAQHSAELQVLRHDLGNESASLDAFIMLVEANPERVMEALPKIKDMRERRKLRIATEKGAMAGASIAAAGGMG